MPERFGRKRKYALGKTSGKANIQKNLQELGLTLNDDELQNRPFRDVQPKICANPAVKVLDDFEN